MCIRDRFEGSYGFAGDFLTSGMLTLAAREEDPQRSRPGAPYHPYTRLDPPAPGTPVPLAIELHSQATRLRRGDVLVLSLAGNWFWPHNPVTGQFPARYQSGSGRLTVHWGGDDGHLLLPVAAH